MQNATLFIPTLSQNASPAATLLIVHGMAEHQKRYRHFAQFLADNGVAVMTFDHLGHGERATSQPENKLGYIGNPAPHRLMIADVIAHADGLASRYPEARHFILGHSMGSFLTRCVLQTYADKLAGAILMGTSSPNPIIAPLIAVTAGLNKIAPYQPNYLFGYGLNKITNAPFAKEPNLRGFNWLNRNPAKVQAYIDDPLCGFVFTNNGFNALFNLMHQGTRDNWSLTVPKSLPLLFVSGMDDPVGRMGKGVPHIVSRLHEQDFADVRFHQYAGMRHEILHEDDYAVVYQAILQWLDGHCE